MLFILGEKIKILIKKTEKERKDESETCIVNRVVRLIHTLTKNQGWQKKPNPKPTKKTSRNARKRRGLGVFTFFEKDNHVDNLNSA